MRQMQTEMHEHRASPAPLHADPQVASLGREMPYNGVPDAAVFDTAGHCAGSRWRGAPLTATSGPGTFVSACFSAVPGGKGNTVGSASKAIPAHGIRRLREPST